MNSHVEPGLPDPDQECAGERAWPMVSAKNMARGHAAMRFELLRSALATRSSGGSLITAFVKNRSRSPGPHPHRAHSGVEVHSELPRQLAEETLEKLRFLEIVASSGVLAKQPRQQQSVDESLAGPMPVHPARPEGRDTNTSTKRSIAFDFDDEIIKCSRAF